MKIKSGAVAVILFLNVVIVHMHTRAQAVAGSVLQDDVIARLVCYKVKAENAQVFRNMITEYVKQSIQQEDNIMAEAFYEEESELVLWLVERWRNKTSLEKNQQSHAYVAMEQLGKTAWAEDPKIIVVQDLEPISKSEWRRAANKQDEPIVVMLFVDGQRGTEQKFKEVYHAAMPKFRSEPGVINYQLSQLASDGTQFVTYEKFRNEEAFQYHLKFPPIKPVLDYLETSIKKQPFQAGLHRLIEIAPLLHK